MIKTKLMSAIIDEDNLELASEVADLVEEAKESGTATEEALTATLTDNGDVVVVDATTGESTVVSDNAEGGYDMEAMGESEDESGDEKQFSDESAALIQRIEALEARLAALESAGVMEVTDEVKTESSEEMTEDAELAINPEDEPADVLTSDDKNKTFSVRSNGVDPAVSAYEAV